MLVLNSNLIFKLGLEEMEQYKAQMMIVFKEALEILQVS